MCQKKETRLGLLMVIWYHRLQCSKSKWIYRILSSFSIQKITWFSKIIYILQFEKLLINFTVRFCSDYNFPQGYVGNGDKELGILCEYS